MKRIDYTKMRLGSIVRRWEYNGKICSTKIALCPKCGRKGERTVYGDKSINYTHESEVVETIPGFPMNIVRAHCSVKPEEETKS